jgi:hypothetical protein
MEAYKIFEIDELEYRLGGDGAPRIQMETWSSVNMDPFPSYAHPMPYTEECIKRVIAAFPLPFSVSWYLPKFEAIDRFNGCCWVETGWDEDKMKKDANGKNLYAPKKAHIVLSGKRIPPMPAMTRYLTAHEYGHAVEDYIAHRMSMTDTDLKKAYAKLRGLPEDDGKYVGRNWHRTVGEIFANDFRLLVVGAEPEFWPHDCARPEESYAMIGWWKQAVEKFACFKKEEVSCVTNASPVSA